MFGVMPKYFRMDGLSVPWQVIPKVEKPLYEAN